MQKRKKSRVDWNAVGAAESFGALAVSRRAKNRGARMNRSGLTTAQMQVLEDSASHLVNALKRAKRPLLTRKLRLELRETGKKDFVAIQLL